MTYESAYRRWQQERSQRALQQPDICILSVHPAEDEVVFIVQGIGDDYFVTIPRSAEFFSMTECTCDDASHRPVRCKHICHVLSALGAHIHDVSDPDFEPTQAELSRLLGGSNINGEVR